MREYRMRDLEEVLFAIQAEREIEKSCKQDDLFYECPFDLTDLPSFGERELSGGTHNIWSWDDTDMIIQHSSGEFVIVPRTDLEDDDELCSRCAGSGEGLYDGSKCSRCHGSGSAGESTSQRDRQDRADARADYLIDQSKDSESERERELKRFSNSSFSDS
jgi:hypothetical protein